MYDCLHYSPDNEKKTQTSFNNCNCQCSCNERKKTKKRSQSPRIVTAIHNQTSTLNSSNDQMELNASKNTSNDMTLPEILKDQMNMEIQNSDDLMQQLEKLFQGDLNDDDLFDAALCAQDEPSKNKETWHKTQNNLFDETQSSEVVKHEDELQKNCLDERLSLLGGILVNNESSKDLNTKNKKSRPSKWLCEEYFQKVKLFELLDQIGDCDRNKLIRVSYQCSCS